MPFVRASSFGCLISFSPLGQLERLFLAGFADVSERGHVPWAVWCRVDPAAHRAIALGTCEQIDPVHDECRGDRETRALATSLLSMTWTVKGVLWRFLAVFREGARVLPQTPPFVPCSILAGYRSQRNIPTEVWRSSANPNLEYNALPGGSAIRLTKASPGAAAPIRPSNASMTTPPRPRLW